MLRRPPSSMVFLAGLIALSVAVAIASGVVLYEETSRKTEAQADAITRGDWRTGRLIVARYNCGACHMITGVDGAHGKVAPDLAGIGKRATIAGSLPNDPWSHPYLYRSPGEHGPYDIISYGSDGQEGGTGIAADISTENLTNARAE